MIQPIPDGVEAQWLKYGKPQTFEQRKDSFRTKNPLFWKHLIRLKTAELSFRILKSTKWFFVSCALFESKDYVLYQIMLQVCWDVIFILSGNVSKESYYFSHQILKVKVRTYIWGTKFSAWGFDEELEDNRNIVQQNRNVLFLYLF